MPVSNQAGLLYRGEIMGVMPLDYNNDGWEDLYLVHYIDRPGFIRDSMDAIIGFAHECAANVLYINIAMGLFGMQREIMVRVDVAAR